MGIPNRHIAGIETLDWKDHDMEAIRRRAEDYPDPTLCPEAAKRGETICLSIGRESIATLAGTDNDAGEVSEDDETGDDTLAPLEAPINYLVDYPFGD